MQRMDTLDTALSSIDMQSPIPEVDLCPTQSAKLLRPNPCL
jgi:hypothetical protein